MKILITILFCMLAVNLQANDGCLYLYKVYAIDIYDGDTIAVGVELGFLHSWKLHRLSIEVTNSRLFLRVDNESDYRAGDSDFMRSA